MHTCAEYKLPVHEENHPAKKKTVKIRSKQPQNPGSGRPKEAARPPHHSSGVGGRRLRLGGVHGGAERGAGLLQRQAGPRLPRRALHLVRRVQHLTVGSAAPECIEGRQAVGGGGVLYRGWKGGGWIEKKVGGQNGTKCLATAGRKREKLGGILKNIYFGN